MWHERTARARTEDVDAVVALAEQSEPRCGETVVVALDGPSGSGKTTLAAGVSAALEPVGTVQVVHLDLVYPGWDGLAAAPALLVDQVLRPIAEGSPAAYRVWSWVHDEWRGVREVPPSRFLVVDGCGSSVAPAGGYAAVRVFVEADRALRMGARPRARR